MKWRSLTLQLVRQQKKSVLRSQGNLVIPQRPVHGHNREWHTAITEETISAQ